MRVLVAHNFYQQPGGEDTVFFAETELLRRYGHEVFEYTDTLMARLLDHADEFKTAFQA